MNLPHPSSRPESRGRAAAWLRSRRRCARSDQLKLSRPAYRLAAVSRRQLAVDALEMRLDRVDGDVHLAGDLGGVEHARHVPQHFPLALGERLDRSHGGPFPRARRVRGPVAPPGPGGKGPGAAGPVQVTPPPPPPPPPPPYGRGAPA